MQTAHAQKHAGHGSAYRGLALMAVLSFLAMYALMYAMVDRFGNVLANLNQAYMAALMAAPMVLIELLVMRGMYPNGRANALIIAGSVLLLAGSFAAIRSQAAISDRQFLRSMIPHHAGAILMCEQSAILDPDIQALCMRIRASQQAEIAEMKAMLRELDER